MVDIDLFRKILSEDDGYITDGDFIPIELFDLMCKAHVDKVKRLFVKQERYAKNTARYLVEVRCSNCNKIEKLDITKTKIFEIISSYKDTWGKYKREPYQCKECQLKEEERKKILQAQADENLNKTLNENTDMYISIYLNPNRSWKSNVTSWQKFREVKEMYVDWGKIKSHIRNMDYYDFLKTPYWKAVSDRVKQKANNRCQMCNGTSKLSTHHRCYDNHGDEVHHLEDLICICQECHEKHHFN